MKNDNILHTKYVEAIRSSPVLVILQLIGFSLILSLAFSMLEYFLLNLEIPANYHHHTIIGLFIVHLVKNLFLTYMDSMLILKWLSTTYILNDLQLIKKEGIININEKIYDLKTIRAVLIHQGIVGKLFNFGDLTINISASGGYREDINMVGIASPEKYKEHLRECIGINIENYIGKDKSPVGTSVGNKVFSA